MKEEIASEEEGANTFLLKEKSNQILMPYESLDLENKYGLLGLTQRVLGAKDYLPKLPVFWIANKQADHCGKQFVRSSQS